MININTESESQEVVNKNKITNKHSHKQDHNRIQAMSTSTKEFKSILGKRKTSSYCDLINNAMVVEMGNHNQNRRGSQNFDIDKKDNQDLDKNEVKNDQLEDLMQIEYSVSDENNSDIIHQQISKNRQLQQVLKLQLKETKDDLQAHSHQRDNSKRNKESSCGFLYPLELKRARKESLSENRMEASLYRNTKGVSRGGISIDDANSINHLTPEMKGMLSNLLIRGTTPNSVAGDQHHFILNDKNHHPQFKK